MLKIPTPPKKILPYFPGIGYNIRSDTNRRGKPPVFSGEGCFLDRWSALAGNRRLKEQLSFQEEGRGLSHAYILCGPAGSGRHTLARLLAAALVCSSPEGDRPCGVCPHCKKAAAGIHPDINLVTGPGEGKPITVDQIRAVRADAYVRPNEAQRKVYILEHAQQMNPSAQNAMLKLLEEGPAYAAFLLIADSGGGLLQTVRSRCEQLELAPLTPAECLSQLKRLFPDRPEEGLRKAALDCQGILGRAIEDLKGGGDSQLEQSARMLADALESGGEWQLFQASMALEKAPKDGVAPLLERTRAEVAGRVAGGRDKKRLLKAADLLEQLRQAAALNANPGQLAGWLCAGMFQDK